LNAIYYNFNEKAKSKKQMTVGNKKLMKIFCPTVIIIKKIRKTKQLFMITELNIYLSLLVAFILLTLSVRLGVSLYQAS
jgi:hypothetical protein